VDGSVRCRPRCEDGISGWTPTAIGRRSILPRGSRAARVEPFHPPKHVVRQNSNSKKIGVIGVICGLAPVPRSFGGLSPDASQLFALHIKLEIVQPSIDRRAFQQFAMCTCLPDFASIHHHNLIGFENG